jgi:hypothetical protein
VKLYRVRFDGQDYFVEALSFGDALEVWHQHGRKDDPKWDDPETPEPEEVAFVSWDAVLRRIE